MIGPRWLLVRPGTDGNPEYLMGFDVTGGGPKGGCPKRDRPHETSCRASAVRFLSESSAEEWLRRAAKKDPRWGVSGRVEPL